MKSLLITALLTTLIIANGQNRSAVAAGLPRVTQVMEASVGHVDPPLPRCGSDRLPTEVRALWVVRTTLTSPDKIRTLIA